MSKKVGFPAMNPIMNNYDPDEVYTFHVQGFDAPIVGKIVDFDTAGEDILLVVEREDGTITKVYVKYLIGWDKSPKDIAA